MAARRNRHLGVDVSEMSYHGELCRAMEWLGQQENVLFLGQGVGNPGTSMSDTLVNVPEEKRIEFPVAEELQTGVAIGLALQGYVPVSIIPRWNFMLRAADQIVNHMDRLPLYSGYRPRVIVRVAVPSVSPFNPGPQHDGDFTVAFRQMLRWMRIIALEDASDIVPAYQQAFDYSGGRSHILVEYTDKYRNVRGGK